MSEKLIRLLLSELTVIRIRCKGKHTSGDPCGAVFEFTDETLPRAFGGDRTPRCPFCKTSFYIDDPSRGAQSAIRRLVQLASVAAQLKDNNMDVEFVVPEAPTVVERAPKP
jgi:hypothetical protein